MSFVSRFVDEDEHFDEVAGCPLAGVRRGNAPSTSSEAACARCRYNVAFPGRGTIGCQVRTPRDVVDRACAEAEPPLVEALTRLRAVGRVVDGGGADAWRALGERWLAGARSDAGRELASVILRFAGAFERGRLEILR